MKRRSLRNTLPILLFSLLVLVGSCDSGALLFSGGPGAQLPVETVENAALLEPGSSIDVMVYAERLSRQPDLVQLVLSDDSGIMLAEYSYEGLDLDFPDLPSLVLDDVEGLEAGIYELELLLYEQGELIGSQTNWFFFATTRPVLKQLSITPHSAEMNEKVEVVVELEPDESLSPYLQFRMNGALAFEGVPQGNRIKFELNAPDEPGVHDLRLDIYPWYDTRLDQDALSSVYHNLELLVMSADPAETGDSLLEFQTYAGLSIHDPPMFYQDNRIAVEISLNFSKQLAEDEAGSGPASESAQATSDAGENENTKNGLFVLDEGRVLLEAMKRSDGLELGITRSGGRFTAFVPGIFPAGDQLSLQILEGEQHLTLVVRLGDRVLYGELISYQSFIPLSSTRQENTGLHFPGDLVSRFSIRSLADREGLESLFTSILRRRYGNFLLYAEGFEFSAAVNQAIRYSDDAYVSGGYLILPPGAWVELPAFALDEYLVNLSLDFHAADSLADAELALMSLSETEEDVEGTEETSAEEAGSYRLFTLYGAGSLDSGGITQLSDLQFGSRIALDLSRNQGLIRLGLAGREVFIPASESSRLRLYLSQGREAAVRLRLDSIQASNTAEEFVNRVLDSLP